VPTTYPKSSPTEMLGLLVLLKDHRGADDLARLADDLDLEIDEILPSSDWAEALRLVTVRDGRVAFTDVGRSLVEASIRERKNILREQLKTTTLFSTLVRALENSPGGRLSGEEVNRLLSFTPAPTDDSEQHIINWGRYTELFRYDPEERVFSLVRHRGVKNSGSSLTEPPTSAATAPSGGPQTPSSASTLEPQSRMAPQTA
jgi:NitT/TauT family transport system ATP-binding protein